MSSTNPASGLDGGVACFSLRRRLSITLLATVSITWALMASVSYFDTRYELNEVYDAQLEQTARVLLPHIVDELYESRKLTLPFLGGLIYLVLGRGLAPLERLARR
jgi:hypothetical protein